MAWLPSKKKQPADPLAAMRAELQRITTNLVEEMRGQYFHLKGSVDASISSLENIHSIVLSAAKQTADLDAKVNDLEVRLRALERAL